MNASTNREYLAVLKRLVEHIRREYHVDGLSDLTGDQIYRWLGQIDPQDLAQVTDELDQRPTRLTIVERASSDAREVDEPVRAA